MIVPPHHYVAPEYYYRILLGYRWSPGVVTFTGHDREQDWDVQKAKGDEGASSKLNGLPVGGFQASFYLADDDELFEWYAFRRLIESTTSGPEPFALPIFHPDLAINGYTDVSNGGIGGLLRDERGGCTVPVKFIEYRPPRPKPPAKATSKGRGKKAASATPGQGEPEEPDPNAAAKRELASLVEEAKKP